MLKAIIFDLDGVLCHTDRYHYQAWKACADRLELQFDETKNNLLRGVSRMESLNIILGENKNDYSNQQKLELCEEKNRHYIQLLGNMSPEDISTDVRKTLGELRDMNIKMAIGSSSKNALTILRKTEIIHYFDVVVDGNSIAKSKPDPEVFIKAAKQLGVQPQNCLVIEDASAGVEAALCGGFQVVGFGPASKLKVCSFAVNSISEILTIL